MMSSTAAGGARRVGALGIGIGARALIGELLDGRYFIGDIGRRRTNTTTRFAAIDTKLGTAVEIEVVDACFCATSKAAEALARQAHAACRIDHPSTVTPRDVGQLDDGTPYVVTRRFEGELLSDRLALTGTLPIQDVVRLGLDLLSALVAAHDARVVHGALHPDHVFLVDREGVILQVLLSGFGTAAFDEDDTTLGFPNIVFVAPECIDGAPLTVKSDLYALAAILFVAATGRAPYTVNRPPIPTRLLSVLARALDPNPERRFDGAHAMLHALLIARVGLGGAYAPADEHSASVRLSPPVVNIEESGIIRLTKEERMEIMSGVKQPIEPIEPIDPAPVTQPSISPVPIAAATSTRTSSSAKVLHLSGEEVSEILKSSWPWKDDDDTMDGLLSRAG